MSSCPCGCSRKVGFTTRGAAIGAKRAKEMLAAVMAIQERLLTVVEGDYDREAKLRAVEAGKRLMEFQFSLIGLRAAFVEHAHKTARPATTPDLLTLKCSLDEHTDVLRELVGLLAIRSAPAAT